MNNFQIQEQEEDFHIKRASKWTVYLLVDLRIVFIISYVYISVLYLISTIANSEANTDINSMKLFNVTSQPNHTNVIAIVSYIDDALLWSCRNLSVTKDYYKGLYSMLFVAFAVTMIFLTITKLTIFFGNSSYLRGGSKWLHTAQCSRIQISSGRLAFLYRATSYRPVLCSQ